MVNKSNAVYNEARNNLRIKENRLIQWRVNDGDIKGRGVIRNISTTGMLLETNSNFIPTDGCRFSFDTSLGHDNFIPQNGKLVWHKKRPFAKNKYWCGVRFVEPGEYVLTKLRGRVQRGIKSIAIRRRLRNVVNSCLIVAMLCMTGYIIFEASMIYRDITATNERLMEITQEQALLNQSYVSRLEATQMELASVSEELAAMRTLYSESQGLLGDVRVDLELTKAVLADTEQLLSQTKADLRRTESESAALRSDMADMEIRLANAQSASQAAADLAREKIAAAEVAAAAAATAAPKPKPDPAQIQAQAQALASVENAKIQEEMATRIAQIEQERASEKDQMQSAIALLEEKNRQLTSELESLRGQWLAMTAADISFEAEGRKLLETYQTEVAKVKDRLRHFRQEARQIREDAMVERDRIQMQLGNNGYLVRNGQPVQVDLDKYRNAGLENIKTGADVSSTAKAIKPQAVPPVSVDGQTTADETTAKASEKRQVQVDVTFVD